MAASKMSPRLRAALVVIRQSDHPVTPTELGQALGTSKEGAAQSAAALVRRGLVRRCGSMGGRATYVAIVKDGES